MTIDSWLLVIGPVVLTAVGKWLSNKIDRVGEHLECQDKEQERTNFRLQRIEERLKLRPLSKVG